MAKTIVRYKVKPALVEENEQLVRAVYAELAKFKPAYFSYATYKLDDGVSFMHIAEFTGEGNGPLSGIAAFAAFQQRVKDRCDELPVVSQGTEVGSYDSALVLQD
jgi:hypothetical protein